MPFAIVVGISSVALLYLAVNFSYFVVLTIPQIEGSVAVAITFAQQALGNLQYAMPFLVTCLLVGSINSTLFAASRYLYAASRERQLPSFLACVHEGSDSPRTALIFHAALAIGFSFLGNIEDLINYVGFAMWMQRAFTMSALIYIRLWKIPVHPETIRTPLIFPIFFLAICCALVVATMTQNFKTSAVGLSMLGFGLFIYIFFIWEKTFQRFDWYRNHSSLINEMSCVLSQIVFNGLIKFDDVDGDINGEDETVSSEKSGDEEQEVLMIVKQRKRQEH